MPTNIPYGSPLANKAQSVGLFTSCTNRLSTINRLVGTFPVQADAENKLRNQTSTDMPIVRCKDLTRMAGDEVTFDLVNQVGGKPIMGGRTAQGKGASLSFDQDKLRINQTRKPISVGDTMTQQRTPHQLRALARAAGFGYMGRLDDQLALVHMAGSRGFHNNVEWVVPLASDPDFADICVNTVRAPSHNRHYFANGNYLEAPNASGNEVGMESTDLMNYNMIDHLRAIIDEMPLPPAPCKFNGDELADDDPLRVLLVSPSQYAAFIGSSTFRTLQAQAMQRSAMAKQNPLFRGEAGLWNGILIVKMPRPIRFYAGNALNWCATATSETETTTDLVPAAFSTSYAIDRAILLGAQALGEALGKHNLSGVPYFWNEEETDHKDKVEVLVGKIGGMSKIRFDVDYGDAGVQPTDHGIIAIDTVVKL
jgi:N4-gp56 family major capsid protein